MIINEMRRDNSNIHQNESFAVVLDTFYDRRNGFSFQTNPLGALRDTAVGDEGESNNDDWNTVWDVGASVFEQGWIAEIVIPFKSLRYKKGRDQIWSINLRRTVKWKNEESFLSPVAASHRYRGVYRFSEAATLVGIQAPSSSRNLELKPYGISTVVTNNDAEPVVSNDVNADVGFDLKYGLTKSLIADFTYNTDFAQVEEDQQQVNLTRFSLFFPEKRDFFLEGRNIFAFAGVQLRGGGSFRRGGGGQNLTPILFFSRRIGLTEGGVDPIIVGGRVTGRAGAYRIGALNIQTDGIEGAVDPSNFSVLRLRRDVLGRSDIGAIATYRDTSASELGVSNGVFGIDGNFAFFTNLRLNAYYAVSQTPLDGESLPGDETSYKGGLDYGGDRYGLELEHLKVGESFRPELGFMRREAFKRSFAKARFSPRAPSRRGKTLPLPGGGRLHHQRAFGFVESRRLQAQTDIEFAAGDRATVEYTRVYEFLPEDFEISDGIVLAAGNAYNYQDVNFVYRFGPQRPVPGFATFRTGRFLQRSPTGSELQRPHRGHAEVFDRASDLVELGGPSRGIVQFESRELAGHLHDVAADVRERLVPIQLEPQLSQLERALSLGVRAGKRSLRRLQRRPADRSQWLPAPPQPNLCGEDDQAIPILTASARCALPDSSRVFPSRARSLCAPRLRSALRR